MQDTAVLSLGYGLRERVNLGLFIPYRWSRATGEVEADVTGPGDLGLTARFGLTDPDRAPWKLSAIAAVTFPTGDVETGFLDENIALGVGAVSLGGGLDLLRDWPVAGRLLLQFVGIKPTGPSDEGVRFGGNLQFLAGYGRPFFPAGRSRWAVSASSAWAEPDTEGDQEIPNRGGRLSYATFGLSFPMGPRWQVGLSGQRLLDADVHGDQLVARWTGFLSFRWLWEPPAPMPLIVDPGDD